MSGKEIKAPSGDQQPYLFLLRYRWILCIASLAITALLAAGLPRLGFNTSWKIFFAPDNPYLIAFEDLADKFSHYDNLMFFVEIEGADLYTQKNIEALRQLTEQAIDLPYALQVHSLVNYAYMESRDEELIVQELIGSDMELSAESLPLIRKKVLKDELLVDRLVNKEGTLTMVIVDLDEQFKSGDSQAIEEVIRAGRALEAKILEGNPDLNIYLFGSVIHDVSATEASRGDMKRLAPLIFLFALLISYFFTRSPGSMLAVQVVVLCSVVAAMGLTGWIGYNLNIVSTMAGALISILALADTVHIGTTYLKERTPTVSKEEAIYISLQKNLRAIFLTSVTTVAGFYSLNFIGSAAFSDMGNIAIYGVLIAFIFSITLFPALLLFFTGESINKGIPQQQLAERIADISIRYRKPLFLFFTVVTLGSAPFLALNRFNDDYRQFFDEKMEIRQSIEALLRHMKSSNQIEYAIESGEENGINNPEFLKKVEAFVEWYKQKPGITHVYSYIDFIKQLNQTMHNNDPDMYRIPASQELASQYLLLYEMSADLDQLITDDKSTLRLLITTDHLDEKALLELEEEAQQWLQAYQPDIASKGNGIDIMFAQSGRQVLKAMKKGSVFTIAFITLVLVLGLKSFKYGFLSLAPNMIPPVVIYGLWGIFVRDMSQAVMVTYSISLGLIIDDTVHVLTKYVQERNKGERPEQAIRKALENTATALMATTLMIGSGLILISFASFKPNAELGMVMAPIVFMALFFDLFLLPGILLYIDEKSLLSKI